ncbi:MAG: APC family permease [Acidobacteriota bacterium]|nr:APC family permease [Acidobacteriota bacterium]
MPGLLRRLLIGDPLPTEKRSHERLTKFAALAVFASDGVSSVAYATEEILLMLALAGTAQLHLSMPIAACIALLIAIVATSFRQVVHAYPHGGGSYAVARENLGVIPGQIAGAALFVDYVLTVAVSVASGVAAITSAFPALFEYRVPLGVLAIAFVTVANLRGVRESARAFMFPTYGFILSLYALIVVGLVRYATGATPVEALPAETDVVPVQDSISLFLILRAFSSGCAALTGLEAVSDGVTAFKEPVSRNAATVMAFLAGILGTLFIGITFLANHLHVMPVHYETVVSQIARATFGRDWFYYAIQAFTAIILILAANTSFNGFPRLASVQAADGFLPRQLANLGDRLVYSNGILALGIVSSLVLITFHGETHRLIPLYAVGVFLTFTLAQTGLVRHWLALRDADPMWRPRMLINGLGAVVTAIVTLVIAITKFTTGAWIVVIVIPVLVLVFLRISRHYEDVSRHLSLKGVAEPPPLRNLVLVLVGSVHRGMLEAVRYAQSLSTSEGTVRAIHIETESDRPRPSLMAGWDKFGLNIPLVVLRSPYRQLVEPLSEYVDKALSEEGFDCVTLVLPEFVVTRWWEQFLHNQTALWFQFALRNKPHVVVANYRYFLAEADVPPNVDENQAPPE